MPFQLNPEMQYMPPDSAKASPAELIAWAQSMGVKEVDVKFTDLRGVMQHFSVPMRFFGEDAFTQGLGFDGSSIRGFQTINVSDLNLIPIPATAFIDPLRETPSLSLICDVVDIDGQPYIRDPRGVAKRAEAYLKTTGLGDTVYFGPEAEFFIFNSARWGSNEYSTFYEVDSDSGFWSNSKPHPNQGYHPRIKEGYFPVPPMDRLADVRALMVQTMEAIGIDVEVHHHEVASAGQCEIDMKFDALLTMADKLLLYKYVVKNVAFKLGYTATFMPKPIFADNGSGMHCHQSIWSGGQPTFFEAGTYANLSQTARWYIGGILKHAPSILAFAAPTTNSYRRLVPGYEAPVNLVYSARNRSAAVRIPMYSQSPKAKRIEFRAPDPTANPYLAFSAMLMAGIDGIQNQIDPGEPADFDLYEEGAPELPQVPGSLREALMALANDHDYLLAGDVFNTSLIETYIEYKIKEEVDAVNLRPHPYEFNLYYDF
jgi:glutamine synthetase